MVSNSLFKLHSKYQPSGDQSKAIKELSKGILENKTNQILLGVTGSGKTFTMAQIIAQTGRPAVIMAHNKILAAQLYSEMKNFFPNNAVEYFISYFDFYQPEAYVPSSDTYIDKDSVVNSKLEQMKLSSIYSLLERTDCIIVCSVSSIYGIQSKKHYQSSQFNLRVGDKLTLKDLSLKLVSMQYVRNEIDFSRSNFRIKGDIVEIFPAHIEEYALRLSFFGDQLESITIFDPIIGKKLHSLRNYRLYAANLFSTEKNIINKALPQIELELQERVEYFKKHNKLIEAQRLYERTKFDLEMLATTGHCKGIEHYTRYLSGISPGEPPFTMFDYLLPNTILFVDESHVSIPQIKAMYKGDFSRKTTLANYGFRLPSCVDNRPLTFEEWNNKRTQTIFVSATPGEYELKLTQGEVVEQIIRPTGLLDPECIIRPQENQMDDFMAEAKLVINQGHKVLAITLTKKMSIRITEYLNEHGFKTKYLHSDIDTFERVEIIKALRSGQIDILVGINLLREGLDIPECALVAIFDADKEGFLRSKTSLIQTIGRAARNSEGKVILYANTLTPSLKEAISETKRRREIQQKWNLEHNIIPQTVSSQLAKFDDIYNIEFATPSEAHSIALSKYSLEKLVKTKNSLEKLMKKAAKELNFEKALELREQIKLLNEQILKT